MMDPDPQVLLRSIGGTTMLPYHDRLPGCDIPGDGGNTVRRGDCRMAGGECFGTEQPIGLDRSLQDRTLVILTTTVGRDINPSRYVSIDFKMSMESPLHQTASGGRLQ